MTKYLFLIIILFISCGNKKSKNNEKKYFLKTRNINLDENKLKNNYGFDFINLSEKKIISILEKEKFWRFNGKTEDKGIKEILIVKFNKNQTFDGYGSIKLKNNRVFEVVFYIKNSYKEKMFQTLENVPIIKRNLWKNSKNVYICFIEDEDLRKEKMFGFSIGLNLCDGKQK